MSEMSFSDHEPLSDRSPSEPDEQESSQDPTEYDGDSEVDGGVLFIRSTISQDDTKDKESKGRDMLVQLNKQFNSGELLLQSGKHFQGPELRPPARSIPTYPAYTGPAVPPLQTGVLGGLPPPPQPFSQPLSASSRHFPPLPFMVGQKPSHKVDRKAEWRQSLLDKTGIAEDSAKNDSQSHENKKSSSWSQNAVTVNERDSMRSLELPMRSNPTNRIGQATINHEAATDPSVQKSIPLACGLAESISYIAQRHLGIDTLDNSTEAAKLNGYLLDTIELLERQISYLRARDDESDSGSNDDPTMNENGSGKLFKISNGTAKTDPDSKEGQMQCSQILHRIFCSDPQHYHSNALFEDEPVFVDDQWFGRKTPTTKKITTGKKVLKGEIPIPNLSSYVTQHPFICFIIFKEHTCASDDKKTKQPERQERASPRSEKLLIVSPILIKALEKDAEFSPWCQPLSSQPTYSWEYTRNLSREMDAPYDFLFHHRKRLAILEKESDTYSTVLAPLREFLEQNYEKEYQTAEDLFQRGRVTPLHMGKLFKPNQMVIEHIEDSHSPQAYVLNAKPSMEKGGLAFKGWSWQYIGSKLRRKSWRGVLALLSDEEIGITELRIHPARFAHEHLRHKIESRGRRFWDMRDRQFSIYNGYDWNQEHSYVNARFMIDMSTYHKMHRHSSLDMTHFSSPNDSQQSGKFDTWRVSIDKNETLSTELMMLLPPMIYGFNIVQKRWVKINVEQVKPMEWNKKAFDRLVLDGNSKELIYALVNVQASKDKMIDDIIPGKGNGLIILLHGSPGTGKTLTAESVAEIAEKPLYRVTCVLLMDEADVFLEERSMADLQRNSLVSVFLRILEYYEGILILTSNRVGTFDEAFKSRIQVAIHYDRLTKASRRKIWENFFEMLKDSKEDFDASGLESRLDVLAAEEMNGRQIRNALLTARQLAKHRKKRLDWEELSHVMRSSAAFNKYLKSVKGHTDDQWAREEGIR
ncbi:AAA family ATPase [Fusarium pseudocircinatum]|uniref:AAA family ATPase n=1 Tax=Fusarium pseudocircinatum TaxID=56676 RepID=A0A8H5KID4_9HYPO|nr:AAA family ATPase [Fusarium pseudocircinatum]